MLRWNLKFLTRHFCILLFIAGTFFFTHFASAKDLCNSYRNTIPLPDWFSKLCTADGQMKATVGGAYSTFADAFNLNPASIPTSSTPYGIEYISSQGNALAQNNFALIKGFERFGAAITSEGQNTFYGSNVFTQNAAKSSSLLKGYSPSNLFPSYNFGGALELSSALPKIGIMGKYNSASKSFSPGVGLSYALDGFTLGASYSSDPKTKGTPRVNYFSGTLGYKIMMFQLELAMTRNSYPVTVYTYSSSAIGVASGSRDVSTNAYFGTLSFSFFHFLFTGALRRFEDSNLLWRTQYHLALQYQLGQMIAVGYLHNYIMGLHSLGIQVML